MHEEDPSHEVRRLANGLLVAWVVCDHACFPRCRCAGKAATGEVVWQERLGGSFSASPVSAEGHIYFVSDNGETTVIEAGPEFHVLARNPLGEKVQASPAPSQGQVFLRTERHLFCIGINDPR